MKIDVVRDHGLIVWGRMSKKSEPWAGIVVSTEKLELMFHEREGHSWVFWFCHSTFTHLKNELITEFVKNLEVHCKKLTGSRRENVIHAIQLLYRQYGCVSPANIFENDLLSPAVIAGVLKMTTNIIGKSNRHQNWFIDEQMIDKIKYLNDKNVRKTIKNNIKNSIVKGRNPKRSKFCVACREATNNIYQHPIFYGFLCENCYSKSYSLLTIAKDGYNCCCVMCLRSFNDHSICLKLILCNFCIRVYCEDCLKMYYGKIEFKFIMDTPIWQCAACSTRLTTCGLRRRITKEQIKNIYNYFPINNTLSIGQKIKTREIHVITTNEDIVKAVLDMHQFPYKIFTYDSVKEIDYDLEHRTAIKLLIRCFPNAKSEKEIEEAKKRREEDDKKKSGRNKKKKKDFDIPFLNPFYYFIKLKNDIENYGPIFWAYETSSSITVKEREVINRFCNNTNPILIGTDTTDVRHRGRFIWTNFAIPEKFVQQYRTHDISVIKTTDEKNNEDIKLLSYNSVHATIKSFLENNVELEI